MGRDAIRPGATVFVSAAAPGRQLCETLCPMCEEVAARSFTRADRTRYRQKVRRCLDVFERMLREERFEGSRPLVGLEVELNLVDGAGAPTMRNQEVLDAIANPGFQTE